MIISAVFGRNVSSDMHVEAEGSPSIKSSRNAMLKRDLCSFLGFLT